MSFVFYATRTSGAEPRFNQILEFAAIRTNVDFEEVERFDAQSRLLPHIVPSPNVLFTARLPIATLTDPSLPSHYEMVRTIRENLLAWNPSTYVGFHSIALDEHFLRQCLYQTLHHPYLTNSDGNTRADVAKMLQASLLFAPDALTIPRTLDGDIALDLCAVAPANGIVYDKASNALAAVEAIIGLARRLNEKAPDLWSTAMRFSKKAAVVDFIENEPIFSLSDFFYGKPRSWLVVLIGANSDNNTERYVFNLGVDPDDLIELFDDELRARLTESPKPVRVLRINNAPILTVESDAPTDASGRRLDDAELGRRAEVLHSDKDFRARLVQAFEKTQQPRAKSSHVEEQIYDGFPCDSDTQLMHQFHTVPWGQRSAIVSRFNDVRLKRLGRRLIHFENPEQLDPHLRKLHDQAVASALLGADSDSPWLTLPKAMDELDNLIAASGPHEIPLLREHRVLLAGQIEQANALIRTHST